MIVLKKYPVLFGVLTLFILLCNQQMNFAAGNIRPGLYYTQIATGTLQTCGLRSDGSVTCQGENNNGQMDVPANETSFTHVSTGAGHTCGVKTDGSILCWGENSYGELDAPAGVFTQVAVGTEHTCGLKNDGSITCWGDASLNKTNAPAGNTFVQITASYGHTCALKNDGVAVCWGENFFGQLNVPGSTSFTQISAAPASVCGVKTNQFIVCWGGGFTADPWANGDSGQQYSQVSTGDGFACGLKTNGYLYCWGTDFSSRVSSAPTSVIFTQISMGGSFGCGLKSDGSVQCWGANGAGQSVSWGATGITLTDTSVDENTRQVGTLNVVDVGDTITYSLVSGTGDSDNNRFLISGDQLWFASAPNYETKSSYAVRVRATDTGGLFIETSFTITVNDVNEAPGSILTPADGRVVVSCGIKTDGSVICWGYQANDITAIFAGNSFTQIAIMEYHLCGLKFDGAILCWGDNQSGQSTPPAGTFTQVSTGYIHTCGVKTDSSVICWGNNDSLQSNVGGTSFVSVSAGVGHTCGLKNNGSVQCWGDNTYDQLNMPAEHFTQITGGNYHTCGLKNDGSVSCWGHNGVNQLNALAGPFTQISAGDNHTCGLKTDGSAVCWGWNISGQLNAPAGSFVQVSAGAMNSCGLKTDGSVACWGMNDNGQSSPPVLDTITLNSKSLDENTSAVATLSAPDPDAGDTLTYSLVSGWGDSDNSAFTLSGNQLALINPADYETKSSYAVRLRVTDSGGLYRESAYTIAVNDVNEFAPVVENQTFEPAENSANIGTVSASDGDTLEPLTYEITGGTGVGLFNLNSTTGAITVNGVLDYETATTHTLEVKVTDSVAPTQSDTATITINVTDVNEAPSLAVINNVTVDEGQPISFNASANDVDHGDAVSYSLEETSSAGATINASGAFHWTTTEADGAGVYTITVRASDNGLLYDEKTFTITVNEVNAAPVLNVIDDGNAPEGLTTTINAAATDSDSGNGAANVITYSLKDPVPAGATINASTGELNWTPGETDGGSSQNFTIVASDGVAAVEESFTLTAVETNSAPTVAAAGVLNVTQGETVEYTLTATDPDIPANSLTFSLANAPSNATIDPVTGHLTWTPNSLQPAGLYVLTIQATDDGEGNLFDTEDIEIYVGNAANLLGNPGFETAGTTGRQADLWVGPKLLKNDRRMCNVTGVPGKTDKIYSHSQNCAFRFSSAVAGTRKLSQVVPVTGLAAGDKLRLSGWVKGVKLGKGARVQATVTYASGTPQIVKFNVLSGSYPYLQQEAMITLRDHPVKVTVFIQLNKTAGTLYVDDLGLTSVPALRGEWFTAP